MKKYQTIFLDMDDVLCDFNGAVLNLFNEPKDKPIDKWEVNEVLGLSNKEFWDIIQKEGRVDFWKDMKPLPHYRMLIEVAKYYSDNVQIATAPARIQECYSGKYLWQQKHAPELPLNIIKYKELLANEHTVLIDDKVDNIIAFNKAGGKGVLFPTRVNYKYITMNDQILLNPLAYVDRELSI